MSVFEFADILFKNSAGSPEQARLSQRVSKERNGLSAYWARESLDLAGGAPS